MRLLLLLLSWMATFQCSGGAAGRPHSRAARRGNPEQTSTESAKFYQADLPPQFEFNYSQSDIDHILEGGFDKYHHRVVDWRGLNSWIKQQLSQSTLRVDTIENADFVFVPVDLSVHRGCNPGDHKSWVRDRMYEYLMDFMNQAPSLLPHLGQLPHLLLLQASTTRFYSKVVSHKNAKFMTFLSCNPFLFENRLRPTSERIEEQIQMGLANQHVLSTLEPYAKVDSLMADDSNYNCQNKSSCVGLPYFQNFLWNTESEEYPRMYLPFDEAVCKRKTLLMFQSYAVRKVWHSDAHDDLVINGVAETQRRNLHQQCADRSQNCTHLPWLTDELTHEKFREGSLDAWYSLQPLGDSAIRGAMYDSLLAYSIPIIMNEEVARSLPYLDVIDYSKFIAFVPEASFMPSPGLSENIVDTISRFDPVKACQQLQELHKVLPVFAYLTDPQHELIRFDSRDKIVNGDDAFTFAMKSLLRKWCRSERIPPARCLSWS